jgi:hypothetical protein
MYVGRMSFHVVRALDQFAKQNTYQGELSKRPGRHRTPN